MKRKNYKQKIKLQIIIMMMIMIIIINHNKIIIKTKKIYKQRTNSIHRIKMKIMIKNS